MPTSNQDQIALWRLTSPLLPTLTLGPHPSEAMESLLFPFPSPPPTHIVSVLELPVPSGTLPAPFKGLTNYFVPVSDQPSEEDSGLTLELLRSAVKHILSSMQEGQHVYLHCYAGISRSPTVAAATLMALNRWSVEDSLRYIAARRPVIQPNAYFVTLLTRFERLLQKRRLGPPRRR